MVSAYLREYPAVSAELRLADRMVNLVDEGIDVAVRIGHLADSSLVARNVGDMRQVVVASPAYLEDRGTPLKPSDLAQHAIIRFTGRSPLHDWSFKENGRDIRVSHVSRYTTNSADAAVLHAEQNGGLAMVLAYQAAQAIEAGRLKIVLADYEPPPMPINLVYPTSRLLSAKVRAFIDLVIERVDWRFSKDVGAVRFVKGHPFAEDNAANNTLELLSQNFERCIGSRAGFPVGRDEALRKADRTADFDEIGFDGQPLSDIR